MQKANGITRQQILSAIKLNGSMTADGLAARLSISPVAVRQHLGALEAEGFLTTTVERRGLGRPVHRYALTAEGDETFPRGYDGLANALLAELRIAEGERAVDGLFARRRERLVAANRVRMQGKPLAERVAELARIQSENGYMAAVQEDRSGYRLIEHNCAICLVARQNACACAHELSLLRELLGDDVTVERESHMMAGEHFCSYRIAPSARTIA